MRWIEFLSHLLRYIPGKLLIVSDGLPGHRSRAVWDFVQEQRGRLWLEFLPAYALELNPVEYLWSHWKQHELPDFTRRQSVAPNAPSNSGDRLLATARTLSIVTILCNAQREERYEAGIRSCRASHAPLAHASPWHFYEFEAVGP